MSGKFLKAAVGRGLRDAGAALKEQGGTEVRLLFVSNAYGD